MPVRPCLEPHCASFATYRGRCPEHARMADKSMRRAGRHVYNTKAWKLLRRSVLFEEPLCRVCQQMATDVDHIDGNPENSARSNLQPLCHACHSEKTRREVLS